MPKERNKGISMLAIIPIALIAITIITAYFAYIYYDNSIYKPMSASVESKKVDITINKGSTTSQISESLFKQGLIKDKNTFKIYLKLNKLDGKLKAGKFQFSTEMNVADIVDRIVKGEVINDSIRVTIPEGYELKDIAEALDKKGLVDKKKFIQVAESGNFDYDFLKGLPERPVRLEGYLFPDTYEFSKDSSEEQIIKRMLDRFGEIFNADMRKKAADMNLSIDKVVTMASIIEREAMAKEERSIVAAVFYNRIKKKIMLQSCATVQYLLGERKDPLLYADLEIESPYNTYKNFGLPVGPIANPGKASIQAALNPADVDYLYFVRKDIDSGTHAFSTTYNQFLKDKEKYFKNLK